MNITLIGYRGCGKSTVAPALAVRLGWQWVDADVEIESAAGCSIKEIFARETEAGFRRRERDTLVTLMTRDRCVIAAGGGAILNADTRRDFRLSGPVVWLQASVETLESRIKGDATTASRRPALSAVGADNIALILAAREPLYREAATIIVRTDGRSTHSIVDEILDQAAGVVGGTVTKT